jgi:23S rRNA (cytidine1920-2'-O)/16S rRNA (cytidine1409-2'-O)-methyltransferase
VTTEIRHRFSLGPEASMRKRADVLLVERGFFASRARAQQAIAAGLVSADGDPVRKASEPISPDAAIVAGAPHPWASRGGVKLAAALDAFALDPAGLACLDIGASTGGFTDVLLRRGARAVLSVDVGHGQFAPKLAADPRVTLREGLDARRLTKDIVGVPPQAIVCDVSFISQRLVLPNVLPLADRAAWLVSLVKPQFEAGREYLVKGAVKDPAALALACEAVRRCVEGLGWTSLGLIASPLAGGDGAREFLYAARHG